jgi:hypothetical protein
LGGLLVAHCRKRPFFLFPFLFLFSVCQRGSESEGENPTFKDLVAVFEEIGALLEKSEGSVEMEPL